VSAPPFTDLRLRAETLRDEDLETLARFGLRAALVCAHRPPGPRERDMREHWDDLLSRQAPRLAAHGIRPLVALGIPGAHIPARGLAALLDDLVRRFDHPLVAAFGELDLASGGPREEALLTEQLSLARGLRRPVILRAPARGRTGLRRLLSLLQRRREGAAQAAGPSQADVLLVDAGEADRPMARPLGLWLGLPVSPSGLSEKDVVRLAHADGLDAVALVSDMGEGPGDLLALPRAAHALARAGFSERRLRALLSEGPLAFIAGRPRAIWPASGK
jgi:predicted metal-dependent TIM-barrel fold hydrolase